jgi:hypothetical protein
MLLLVGIDSYSTYAAFEVRRQLLLCTRILAHRCVAVECKRDLMLAAISDAVVTGASDAPGRVV